MLSIKTKEEMIHNEQATSSFTNINRRLYLVKEIKFLKNKFLSHKTLNKQFLTNNIINTCKNDIEWPIRI